MAGRDVLMANVGHVLGHAFLDQEFEEARHVIDTNVTGTVYLVYKIGRDMRTRGREEFYLRVPSLDLCPAHIRLFIMRQNHSSIRFHPLYALN